MISYEDLHLTNLPFHEEFKQVFDEVLQKGQFILGEKVERFEHEFAQYIGVKHCIGVASGTDAIMLCLKTLDLPTGSEVIVPDNTFIGTALAVIHSGMKPVLVPPNPITFNIDEEHIRPFITSKTRAIIAVHMYGKCCDMDAILKLANEKDLYVIEDAAHAHGATYKGKKAGSLSHMGTFSFYPTKILGALGDGGAVTTNDDLFATKMRKWRNYGFVERSNSELPGYNSRLDELQSAFLSIKLKHLDKIIAHKRKLAAIYLSKLQSDFTLPVVHPHYDDVYYAFVVRHPERAKLLERMDKSGIGYGIHYPKWISEQALFGGKEATKDYFSLPLAFYHTESDIEYVCSVLNEV